MGGERDLVRDRKTSGGQRKKEKQTRVQNEQRKRNKPGQQNVL